MSPFRCAPVSKSIAFAGCKSNSKRGCSRPIRRSRPPRLIGHVQVTPTSGCTYVDRFLRRRPKRGLPSSWTLGDRRGCNKRVERLCRRPAGWLGARQINLARDRDGFRWDRPASVAQQRRVEMQQADRPRPVRIGAQHAVRQARLAECGQPIAGNLTALHALGQQARASLGARPDRPVGRQTKSSESGTRPADADAGIALRASIRSTSRGSNTTQRPASRPASLTWARKCRESRSTWSSTRWMQILPNDVRYQLVVAGRGQNLQQHGSGVHALQLARGDRHLQPHVGGRIGGQGHDSPRQIARRDGRSCPPRWTPARQTSDRHGQQ